MRNRLKVAAAVTNAQAFLKVQEEFGSFDNYLWQFVGGSPIQNLWKTFKHVPTSTPESDAMSRDLKKRGFKFVGSTICYAHMQACGMVNDHTVDCFRYRELARAHHITHGVLLLLNVSAGSGRSKTEMRAALNCIKLEAAIPTRPDLIFTAKTDTG